MRRPLVATMPSLPSVRDDPARRLAGRARERGDLVVREAAITGHAARLVGRGRDVEQHAHHAVGRVVEGQVLEAR